MMVDTTWENQRKNDTDRYELERSIQASRRGGRMKSTGSKPIAENGLPVCVLPMKAPVPDEPNVRPRPDGPFKRHFHAAISGFRHGLWTTGLHDRPTDSCAASVAPPASMSGDRYRGVLSPHMRAGSAGARRLISCFGRLESRHSLATLRSCGSGRADVVRGLHLLSGPRPRRRRCTRRSAIERTSGLRSRWPTKGGSSRGLRSGLPGGCCPSGGWARDTREVRSPALMLGRWCPGFSRGGVGSAVRLAPLGVSVV